MMWTPANGQQSPFLGFRKRCPKRGPHTRIFKQNAGGMESACLHTTPEDGDMIWEEELIKDRRRREWWAFYAGCVVGAAVLSFSLLFLVKLTGGTCP